MRLVCAGRALGRCQAHTECHAEQLCGETGTDTLGWGWPTRRSCLRTSARRSARVQAQLDCVDGRGRRRRDADGRQHARLDSDIASAIGFSIQGGCRALLRHVLHCTLVRIWRHLAHQHQHIMAPAGTTWLCSLYHSMILIKHQPGIAHTTLHGIGHSTSCGTEIGVRNSAYSKALGCSSALKRTERLRFRESTTL